MNRARSECREIAPGNAEGLDRPSSQPLRREEPRSASAALPWKASPCRPAA